MELKDLQKTYDDFARIDPFWAILSHRQKRGRRWEVKEFFATGDREIESVMRYVDSLQVALGKGMALDFGCGVGRLTQALARYFDHCYGVDISSEMIRLANEYNHHGARCRYLVNESADLRIFSDATFDFIYTNIVLQHMKRAYSLAYIRDFLRIMKPDGLSIFQIPSERLADGHLSGKIRQLKRDMPMYHLYRRLRYGTFAVIEIHCIQREDLIKFIETSGGRVVDVTENKDAGSGYVSMRYSVAKG